MAISQFSQRLLRRGLREGITVLSRSMNQPAAGQLITDLLLRSDRPAEPAERTSDAPRQNGRPRRDARRERTRRARGADAEFAIARKAHDQPVKQGFPRRPSGGYPGDFTGTLRPVYSPDLNGRPDPGEIVWAWVPYEEDHSRGKDRPVLLVGREGGWLLGLMLTSKDHIPGSPGEVRQADGAEWMNIGSGDWDAEERPSEIRLDRIIRIAPKAVRREGAVLPMSLYSTVVENVHSGS